MASLYKRNSGTYYAQFYDSKRSPSRKRFSLRTSTKRSARQKLTELENAFVEGKFDPWANNERKADPFNYDRSEPSRDASLSDAIRQFAEAKRKQGRSERTIGTYRNLWERFADRFREGTTLSGVSPSDIEAFCYDDSVTSATRHKRYRHLHAILSWAEEEDLVAESPIGDISAPQKEEKLPTPVRKEDLPKLCSAVAKRYRKLRREGNCRPRQIIWAIPVFRWAFFTGMRATEIGRLRWKHIDQERGLIRITEQKNRKAQTIPLISPAEQVLRSVPRTNNDEAYVFRTPDGPIAERNAENFGQTASRHFCQARRDSEIDRELTFHDLRAGFATALADAGKSAHVIREAMRHSSLKMALKYVRVSRQRLHSEMESAFG
ncbi:tyrosine-type recombinase/integrase [Salinibacter ruber]|uniref:Integrase n=1 Tax=Salinibacter ruber TaxID=146919 RepID=A0A9X2U8V3_9BACT|nr:site-specific integrase [Salinibacter ruber]MCS3658511.1 integrase [Salinibacter ruber]MCS3952021.1 integrase [Salinibacter ruber]MCS4118479.1 integrase [Salinibacter ruber]MCS4154158.1 integrase [Salinibacter ruber]